MNGPAVDARPEGGMTLEVDALRRLVAEELVGAGVHVPVSELARISAAILAEAVRISVEWVEAETGY